MLNLFFCLASSNTEEEVLGVAFLALIGILCLFGIAIGIALIVFISTFLKRVPPPYRKMEPGMVWLLMIPLFNLVWNFFVYKAISASYQAYFESRGHNPYGDCGKSLGLAYSICCCCSLIPLVGMLTGIAALVLQIILLVKFSEYKKQIPAQNREKDPPPYPTSR